MPFDTITDKWGRTISPARRTNHKGRIDTLSFIEPYAWGGRTHGGIYVDHTNEDLPMIFGIVRAIRHDSAVCISRLSREAGGIMPGDLVHYPRYAAFKITDVDILTTTTDFEGEQREYAFESPLLVLPDSEILARVDGILEDPWVNALQSLVDRKRVA